jgi:hypothetical protein
MVRREVLVREGVGRVDTLPGVEDEHGLEEVERLRVRTAELLREGDALPLREGLDETEGLLRSEGSGKGTARRMRKWKGRMAEEKAGREERKERKDKVSTSRREEKEVKRTFSLQMVWMTSSGGVPRSSVMIENWLT